MIDEKRRRHLRTSLRAMMLLIVVVGFWLGRQVDRAREQRQTAAAVRQYGGWVHYDYEFVNGKFARGRTPRAPRWLREAVGDEYFQEIQQVSLVYDDSTGKRFDNRNVGPCDDLLERLSSLPGLRVLLLQNTQATDEGLRHIGKMSALEELFIWNARSVTDAGVAHLANLENLKDVHINEAHLTDKSLAILSGLPSVERLSLQQNDFSDDGLARMRGQECLKELYLGMGDSRVTDAGLAHLSAFKKLEILDVQHSSVTARGLERLLGLPNLKKLWVNGTAVTDAEKQAIRKAVPRLSIQ